MWFAHSYAFENYGTSYYDGGVLQYSVNGGATWFNVNSIIQPSDILNGYNGTISNLFGNPLGGQQGFVADSHGYISSRFGLDVFSGTNVRFRWVMGLDYIGYDLGWILDDVMIYNCAAPPGNDNFANATTISGALPYNATFSDAAASLELVEQGASCDGSVHIKDSVWFKYTAASTQAVTFALTGAAAPKTSPSGRDQPLAR